MANLVRIFVSSPADVQSEQSDVVALASEINDVIAFLAPALDIRVEVIRYQDNTYPDVGGPQAVIERQIPQDYEIHLGIMWMRCGSPTKGAPSGTVHEFRQAMKRREETGSPIIMFYFSDERPPSMPSQKADLDQIGKVLDFREELQNIGLTMTYPNRESFRERVRVGLLRAISDVAKSVKTKKDTLNLRANEEDDFVVKAIRRLAGRYEEIRRTMSAGPKRTQEMSSVFASMCSEAPATKSQLSMLLNSTSEGDRLFAVAILQNFPEERYFPWLAERLDPEVEKPFIGFQAGVALLQAARSHFSAGSELASAIERALELAHRNPNDPPRIRVLDEARREVRLAARRYVKD